MIVKSIELKNYRNYDSLQAEFAPGTNLIYGDNAQGKTNLLEAVFECATGSSHRGSRERELIRFDEEEAHIRLVLERGGVPSRIDLHLRKNKSRGVAIDGVPLQKISELLGRLNVIFFSPEDLRIIKNSPQERRRFLNIELCQLDALYTRRLVLYNKALEQRNALLKDPKDRKERAALLDVWDEKLSEYGEPILEDRAAFIRELGEIIRPIHRELTENKEDLALRYAPGADPGRMAEQLFLGRDQDIHFGSTSIGPHRDELEFYINGKDVKRFGSQGQQRTTALSLKLAEIELVKKKIHDTPVLLLDDVLSELDAGRQERLLAGLDKTQTLITCTGLDEFVSRSRGVDKKFRIVEGKIAEEKLYE